MSVSPLVDGVRRLVIWFHQNNIDTETAHVIINIADRHAAAAFHHALQREADDLFMIPALTADPIVKDLQIVGLKIKIETPFTEGT